MKPNFSLSREAILTLIAIFLLGIAIMVSLVLLAFLFSGNISELKVLLPPTRVPPTAARWIPTKIIPATAQTSIATTIASSTAVLPTSPTSTTPTTIFSTAVVPPTPAGIVQTPESTIPTPDYSEALAEIGVFDTSRSTNGTSVIIKVSIYNFGTSSFTLSKNNVTLTQPDGKGLTLKSSNPDLPQEIQPGQTQIIELDFELPSAPTATLKILTLEYDVAGY